MVERRVCIIMNRPSLRSSCDARPLARCRCTQYSKRSNSSDGESWPKNTHTCLRVTLVVLTHVEVCGWRSNASINVAGEPESSFTISRHLSAWKNFLRKAEAKLYSDWSQSLYRTLESHNSYNTWSSYH